MRIIIISGPPGSGKSSIAKELSKISQYEQVVHIHSDDFYHYICKGYIPPWLPNAHMQNQVVIEAFTESAVRYAQGGYEVIVDGVIGISLLEPWLKVVQRGIDVRYVILRPDMQTTIKRGVERQGINDLRDEAVLEKMWHFFADLGKYESHALDTSNSTMEESVRNIINLIDEDNLRLAQL